MKYEIAIRGKIFHGTSTKMLGTAVKSLKDYVIPCLRYLIDREKYTDKWNTAKNFLEEYFDLVIFMKEVNGEKISEAIEELNKAFKLDSDKIMEYLQKSKAPNMTAVIRAIKGKVDGDDALDQFLSEDTDDDEDDGWED